MKYIITFKDRLGWVIWYRFSKQEVEDALDLLQRHGIREVRVIKINRREELRDEEM